MPALPGRTTGAGLKLLTFFNWIALGIGALFTLLYAVVCLMMLPYPELVDRAAGSLDGVLTTLAVVAVFTLVAGIATRLLVKRHPALWLGQGMLVAAAIAVVLFAVSLRL